MATLVLTTIGTIVGGPIGGAIGAIVGQQIDQRLFAPKGRQGPRLNELTVQTSTYGQAIPKLFGTMRVAGTVIWATDLREEKHSSGGGKSGPKTTTYSYSASFAVALSARPIRAVHRIWADGKLLRGVAGDWKSETGFRLYLGGEGQDVDALIAAAEGAEGTPAYRGIAYALFEDFQLADYGNHIPSLTFEVEADVGAVEIGEIAAVLSGGDVIGDTETALGGYAASGDSVRGAIEVLANARAMSIVDDGTALRLTDGAPEAIMLADEELGASADGKRVSRRTIDRQSAGTLPDEIAIAYYEPSRDYQAGLQRARRGGPGRRVEKIELPAALAADEAKACAERRLATVWSERAQATLALPWRRMELRPGGRVSIPDTGGTWRITGWTLERMVAELKLVGVPAGGGAAVASPGRATSGADGVHGPTVVHLLDLPPLGDGGGDMARLWIAAGGPQPGWRRAELTASLDGGTSWTPIGRTAPPAVMGSTLGVLGAGNAALVDRINSVEIELLNDTMWLESRDDDALVGGATNVALLGDELIQFGVAQQTGARRFMLSRLLRGRRGSEWAMAGHVAGERFVLIEAATLLPFDFNTAAIGSTIKVMAQGVGDGGVAVDAEALFAGRALRPPSPVHIRGGRLADGTIRIGWTRRSRIGWAWLDGSDAPLGEETERYRLVLTPSAGTPRTIECGAAGYDYTPAEQTADGSSGATAIAVELAQLGSIAASLPAATATFDI
jgi:hypothetical protein